MTRAVRGLFRLTTQRARRNLAGSGPCGSGGRIARVSGLNLNPGLTKVAADQDVGFGRVGILDECLSFSQPGVPFFELRQFFHEIAEFELFVLFLLQNDSVVLHKVIGEFVLLLLAALPRLFSEDFVAVVNHLPDGVPSHIVRNIDSGMSGGFQRRLSPNQPSTRELYIPSAEPDAPCPVPVFGSNTGQSLRAMGASILISLAVLKHANNW